MGERVNGIHEVRGSIPLASIRQDARQLAAGRAWVPALRRGDRMASIVVRSRE